MAAHLQFHNPWLPSFKTKQHTTVLSIPSKSSIFKLHSNNNDSSNSVSGDQREPEPAAPVDSVKLALERAKAYKKQKSVESTKSSSDEAPEDKKKILMEKAKDYKTSKGEHGDDLKVVSETERNSGINNEESAKKLGRDAKKEKLSVSSIDFVGLGFSEKKRAKGLPPGLTPITNPFPESDVSEVEIIVGDTSKFGDSSKSKSKSSEGKNEDLYKPKVSTWGVFPRPGDISKSFGGGRTIRPGDVLETAEERAAKDARTQQLLAAYKKKVGLNIDPKLKYECAKALKDGDSLMDSGKLLEALPFYEKVMDKLPFQSELHGLAALQWSICQDSLRRSNEARVMYEKLQSHPVAKVNKKARQFMFSFEAMEMMKVTAANSSPKSTGYQNYFEAFIDDDKVTYNALEKEETSEGVLNQALPYMILLVSPIFLVLFAAIQDRNIN